MSEKTKQKISVLSSEGEGVILSGFGEGELLIIEILFGDASVQIGTEVVLAEEGDFIFVPSGLVYRIESADSKAGARILVIDRELAEENMEKIDSQLFYTLCLQSRNRISVFKPEHKIYEVFAYSMSEACDEYAAKDVCFSLTVRANVYLLLAALLRHYCDSRDSLDRMLCHNVMRLRPTIDYITEHCGEKIYIDTLADMIEVSPDYFTKMFKESIGKTPIDYINTVRVNRALELLSVTETPINDIAEQSGFANANYFHKIFKQYMNTSPLCYRKAVTSRD